MQSNSASTRRETIDCAPLYLGRAHSLGHARRLTNLLGYALMVNSLALHRHRKRHAGQTAA